MLRHDSSPSKKLVANLYYFHSHQNVATREVGRQFLAWFFLPFWVLAALSAFRIIRNYTLLIRQTKQVPENAEYIFTTESSTWSGSIALVISRCVNCIFVGNNKTHCESYCGLFPSEAKEELGAQGLAKRRLALSLEGETLHLFCGIRENDHKWTIHFVNMIGKQLFQGFWYQATLFFYS